MNKILSDFENKINELDGMVSDLVALIGEDPLPKKVRESILRFKENVSKYYKSLDANDIDSISDSIKTIGIYSSSISQSIIRFNAVRPDVKEIAMGLMEKSRLFKKEFEDSGLDNRPLNADLIPKSMKTTRDFSNKESDEMIRKLQELIEYQERHDERVKKLLNENEAKISQISERSKQLESEMKAEIEKVTALYSNALKDIEVKESQINDILGHASGRVIAGDFETSAGDEKVMANRLRYASLACMAIIVAIVTFSFFETTQADFEWKSSIFRIVLAVMLSIPAAYLARESAKHRAQQYEHQQTSLDLKAITPYIASLPEEEQHKIKIEIANRLFAARDFTKTNIDSYPINTHELMMELIKKLDAKKSG
jgi:hypothetical protein